MASDEELVRLLHSAAGPAPWYWDTFPRPTGASGKGYEWRFHGKEGELAYLVSLHLPAEPTAPRLALNTYCRPFRLTGDSFGIWCPEGHNLRFAAFDPDSLKCFDFVEIAGWFKGSGERIYAATPPVAEFIVPISLPEGMHPFTFPDEFQSVEEVLVAAAVPSTAADEPSLAIFVLYPHAGLVEVLPQRWFTPRQFELGTQWVSRVVRDPDSHRILGEGVRMGVFELTDDGKDIRRWIKKEF